MNQVLLNGKVVLETDDVVLLLSAYSKYIRDMNPAIGEKHVVEIHYEKHFIRTVFESGELDVAETFTQWFGGEPPVKDDQPIRMLWSSGLKRTYERGDMIVWRNLPTDGSVRWKKP